MNLQDMARKYCDHFWTLRKKNPHISRQEVEKVTQLSVLLAEVQRLEQRIEALERKDEA